MKKNYFHKVSQEEIDNLISEKKSWRYVMENYKQPNWCQYHEALNGTMGCWSLTDISKKSLRTKISKKFCSDCDCFANIK